MEYVCVCSVVSDSASPWTIAHPVPLSMGFPREEYRSRLPSASPLDLPDSGTEPASPVSPALAGRFFTVTPTGKPLQWNRRDQPLLLKSNKALKNLSCESTLSVFINNACSGNAQFLGNNCCQAPS